MKLLKISLLSIFLTGCASFPTGSEIYATAEKLGTDAKGYAQTLANALQTVNTVVQTGAPVLKDIAASWGLLPVNSRQSQIFDTVVADTAKVSGDVSKVNAVLNPANLNQVVATAGN